MGVDRIGLPPTAAIFQRCVVTVQLQGGRVGGVPIGDENARLDLPRAGAALVAVDIPSAGHHVLAAGGHLRDDVMLAHRMVAVDLDPFVGDAVEAKVERCDFFALVAGRKLR